MKFIDELDSERARLFDVADDPGERRTWRGSTSRDDSNGDDGGNGGNGFPPPPPLSLAAGTRSRLDRDADVRGGPAALEAPAARAGGVVAFEAQDVVARRGERRVRG